jgi:16S rRNA (cytidine1402-2'-O)-methyltransferase
MSRDKGLLYLCATPIGNLEDVSRRVLRVLGEVDLVAAEDTRHTLKLFSHFDIHTPLTSYHEHNKKSKGEYLLQQLLEGKNVALVTDAGLPGISDPGEDMVALAVGAGVQVVPLPGPSAALTALVASGLPTGRFVFEGFLPARGKQRKQRLEELKGEKRTIILYESPHRIKDTLAELAAALGERRAAVGRELTKKYEEIRRGTLPELLEWCREAGSRGEYTLVLAGSGEDAPSAEGPPPDGRLAAEHVFELESRGVARNEAIKRVARLGGISRRELYDLVVRLKDEKCD